MTMLTNFLKTLYKDAFAMAKYKTGQIVLISEDHALHTIVGVTYEPKYHEFVYELDGVGKLLETEIEAYLNEYGNLGMIDSVTGWPADV